MRRPLETRIHDLKTELAQKQARLDQLKRRQSVEARKRDTRRKILVGAVMLKAADQDPELAVRLRSLLDQGLFAARDRALFGLAAQEVASTDPAEFDDQAA